MFQTITCAFFFLLAATHAWGESQNRSLSADELEKKVQQARLDIEGEILDTANRLKRELDLDDEQHAQVKQLHQERFSKWFKQNDERILSILRRFIQLRYMKNEDTSDKMISEWARDVLPIWKDFIRELDESFTDTLPLLDFRQQEKLEELRDKQSRELSNVERELKTLESWHFNPEIRKQREEERRKKELQKKRAEQVHRLRSIQHELGQWEKHVQEFCDLYELDESQIGSAYSILYEMVDRADGYLGRRKQDIHLCGKKLIEGYYPDEESAIDAIRILLKPIDDYFLELDKRLHRLPTSVQIRRAEQKKKEEKLQDTDGKDTSPEIAEAQQP